MVTQTVAVTTDRVKRVKIDGYDQVFALTQWIVNNGLEQNHLEAASVEGSKLNEDLAFEQPGAGSIYGAKVGAPRIMVETGYAEDLSGVLYVMFFTAGTFELVTTVVDAEGKPVRNKKGKTETKTAEYEMVGWRIAFSMQLGMTLVERSSDKFKKLGIKAGEYSLNELAAKFETAEFQPKSCTFGEGKQWSDFSKQEQDGFEFVITRLKSQLLDVMKECGTVGYALKDNNETDNKPKITFKPNKIQYQTYPWVDSGAINFQPVSSFSGNSRLNYLLYCETTGTRDLPAIDKRFLPRNGNWTDGRLDNLPDESQPESVEFGAFHMSRTNFFDNYLLKKLRKLNSLLEPSLSFAWVKVDDWAKPYTNWNCDLTIGDRRGKSEEGSFYDFKLVPGSNPPTWLFESSYNGSQGYDQAGLDGWSAKVWGDAACQCRNTVSFQPGLDVVTVQGTADIAFSMRFWEYKLIGSNTDRTEKLRWRIEWEMQLDLEAVSDGGLQIKSVIKEPTQTNYEQGISTLDSYQTYTKNAITAASSNLSKMQKELAEDLAGNQGLVLPAGGVFFFKNPVLGHDGDLICSIAYSKVQPKVLFDPNDNTAINEQAANRVQVQVVPDKSLPSPATGGQIPR